MEYIKFKISNATTKNDKQEQVVIHELESNVQFVTTYDLPIILNALVKANISQIYFTLDSSHLDGTHKLR